jgi:cell division septum initiation protein DivIVA
MEDFLQIMQENSDKIYSLDQKLEQITQQANTVQNAPIGLTMEQEMVADAQKTIGNRFFIFFDGTL